MAAGQSLPSGSCYLLSHLSATREHLLRAGSSGLLSIGPVPIADSIESATEWEPAAFCSVLFGKQGNLSEPQLILCNRRIVTPEPHGCAIQGCLKVKSLSHVQLFATPWTVAYKTPPSMEFFRQENWSGLPFLLQGIFPTQGSNPGFPHCRQMLYPLSHQGSPKAA